MTLKIVVDQSQEIPCVHICDISRLGVYKVIETYYSNSYEDLEKFLLVDKHIFKELIDEAFIGVYDF